MHDIGYLPVFSIHPSIIHTCLVLFRVTGICWSLSQLSLGKRQGYILDRSPVHRRTTCRRTSMHTMQLFFLKQIFASSWYNPPMLLMQYLILALNYDILIIMVMGPSPTTPLPDRSSSWKYVVFFLGGVAVLLLTTRCWLINRANPHWLQC